MIPNTVEPPQRSEKRADKIDVRTQKKTRVWPWILLLALAGGAVYLYPRVTQSASTQQDKGKKGGRGADAGRAVPVVASVARRGDMPVYVTGLGSAVALNTVAVKTRVDGHIMKIYYTEGQIVKEGDPLVEIDPRPFQVQKEQAEGALARDQAMLANARLDMKRYEVLFSQDAIPKQQLDTQVATVNQIEATIKTDQAAIDNANLQLVYAHITAPLSGRIGLRLVDQGNFVHASDVNPLAVITQLQPIAVIFSPSEDTLPAVNKKLVAGEKLPVVAYDRDNKAKIATGTLLTIDNQVDPTTATVKFKAIFDNKDLSLFPNQFLNARLLLETRHGAIMIPTAAIQRSPQATFVYVVNDSNTAEVRNITVGQTEGDEAEITKGIQAGEKVVIDGIDKLQQGTKVNTRIVGAGGKQGDKTS
jgi:multidrug efflux system membrane fusion protein